MNSSTKSATVDISTKNSFIENKIRVEFTQKNVKQIELLTKKDSVSTKRVFSNEQEEFLTKKLVFQPESINVQ